MLIKYDRLHVYHHWQIHLLSFFFSSFIHLHLKKMECKNKLAYAFLILEWLLLQEDHKNFKDRILKLEAIWANSVIFQI